MGSEMCIRDRVLGAGREEVHARVCDRALKNKGNSLVQKVFFSGEVPQTAWYNHRLVFTTPPGAFPLEDLGGKEEYRR